MGCTATDRLADTQLQVPTDVRGVRDTGKQSGTQVHNRRMHGVTVMDTLSYTVCRTHTGTRTVCELQERTQTRRYTRTHAELYTDMQVHADTCKVTYGHMQLYTNTCIFTHRITHRHAQCYRWTQAVTHCITQAYKQLHTWLLACSYSHETPHNSSPVGTHTPSNRLPPARWNPTSHSLHPQMFECPCPCCGQLLTSQPVSCSQFPGLGQALEWPETPAES